MNCCPPFWGTIKIQDKNYLQFCNNSTCNCYSNLKWNTVTVLFDLVNVGIQKKLLENMYLLKPKISTADGLNSVPHYITRNSKQNKKNRYFIP